MTSRGKCLVIEDDPDIGGLLEVILTGAGFDVHIEETGTDGLLTAASLEPALITLDVGLPDMDGRHVVRKLREITQAPILMITAFAQTDYELDGMAGGATAYLSKPFRPAALRSLVQRLCPERDPARALSRLHDTPDSARLAH
ncbi:hypothetical protein StoSoilA2_21190 [Arthrobacter sp. StoSoilA2]|uniref:response regulator transcription factor n=1 Tax=Arthrobacter sp. StoSoilA2 TaxID=2830990 RepID=UPI001CC5C483|nr:response regulator [Arthrobacter sp. StoSoilA2]BCW36063.1 hypothetical protein StoSoilA2_21190 [Arthrobacter sp. StoSoilA2]